MAKESKKRGHTNTRHLKNPYTFSKKGLDHLNDELDTLEREWDIERALQLNGAAMALTGTVLAMTVNKKWMILPLIATAFLAQQSLMKWCPLKPLFQKLGFRDNNEIVREKMALKALKGQFKDKGSVDELWEALK
jgi:hypothetical protein